MRRFFFKVIVFTRLWDWEIWWTDDSSQTVFIYSTWHYLPSDPESFLCCHCQRSPAYFQRSVYLVWHLRSRWKRPNGDVSGWNTNCAGMGSSLLATEIIIMQIPANEVWYYSYYRYNAFEKVDCANDNRQKSLVGMDGPSARQISKQTVIDKKTGEY